MCGLCGYVLAAGVPDDRVNSVAMRDVLAHRGPDGVGDADLRVLGSDQERRGWMGFRRLRIIDLSERSDQPMSSEDGLVTLTYNGEIYNFRELRRELLAAGKRFRSAGDTEVILRAYEAWGEDFLPRLDGMFAIAIWDAREGRLILARDRTGKKPLFYASTDRGIAFASEIKSLLVAPWVERTINAERLPEFLTYGYIPHPHTFYEGVLQVPPASYLAWTPQGPSGPRRYWDALPDAQPLRPDGPFLSRVADLVGAAVERRMLADVPLGALLSGGIDSSIVVGLMSARSPDPVRTFSIGFPEAPSFDERAPARQVAAHFKTRHTEFAVELDAVGLMDRLLWHHDQPYADSSAIPTYIVSHLAREHVTVVLNGDGGDEVFGGYDRFVAAAVSGRVPGTLGRLARQAAGLLPSSHGYYSVQRRAARFFELADRPVEERYQSWIAVANEDLLAELLGRSPGDVGRSMRECYDRAGHLPQLDRILYANFGTYLPDDLAVKMDRMSMANSLETRSPFLDTAVIEHLARLPAGRKVGVRRLKPVLRNAFRPLLPESIWNRRKHGFGVPVGSWFRGELGIRFEDEVLASDARTGAMLDRGAVGRLYEQHRHGNAEHGFRLWTLLTLELWLRSLERPLALEPPDSTFSATAGGALA